MSSCKAPLHTSVHFDIVLVYQVKVNFSKGVSAGIKQRGRNDPAAVTRRSRLDVCRVRIYVHTRSPLCRKVPAPCRRLVAGVSCVQAVRGGNEARPGEAVTSARYRRDRSLCCERTPWLGAGSQCYGSWPIFCRSLLVYVRFG